MLFFSITYYRGVGMCLIRYFVSLPILLCMSALYNVCSYMQILTRPTSFAYAFWVCLFCCSKAISFIPL